MYNQHSTDTIIEDIDYIGDGHIATSIDTPIVKEAVSIPDTEKISIIADHFEQIMITLGLDMTDDSLMGTPKRVAKMFVNEKFKGLSEANKPSISLFENSYGYSKMLVERDIKVDSTCEHHFLPIVGKAHVGYISSGKVIGLSKINRIVDYYSRRPQVQERLSRQVLVALQEALDTEDVIVVIDAHHHCVSSRGIQDPHSSTVSMEYGGEFSDRGIREEFMKLAGL